MDEFSSRSASSAYLIIFPLDKVKEEKILQVENQIISGGFAHFDRNSNYSEGVRTWLLDWKNDGETPQEIIQKLKKYQPEIYKLISIKRIT
jgi:hypothetical protein